jgi:hypothetical protein
MLIRTFNVRELILSLFGLLAPYLLVYAIYYVSGEEMYLFTELIVSNIITPASNYYWSPLLITVLIVGTILLVTSLAHLASVFASKKIKTRKIFSLLIWILILSLAVYFFVPSASVEVLYILLIPFVYIVAHFIVIVRNKKIANVVFAIYFLTILVIQIYLIYN